MRVEYLARHPEHVATLAALHLAQWQAMLPDWTYANAFAELASHAEGPVVPTTVVALDDEGTLLGSCSLLQNDHDDIRDYSPWLASLYVLESHRGHGVGRALTQRVVADAAALGIATLYLYTYDAQRYYTALGWGVCAQYAFGPLSVDVMSIATTVTILAQACGIPVGGAEAPMPFAKSIGASAPPTGTLRVACFLTVLRN